jgi:hypothetical protein
MNLRFRQLHLDFHTSEHIPNVGCDFDVRQFQEALKRGCVDSVNLFAKCHHGWSYYNTGVGKRHPNLGFDLLARQIEACQQIGVKTPIYVSVGHDELAAREHPEWMVVDRDGCMGDPLKPGYCMLGNETPYLDYLCEQIEEIVDVFGADDGFWLDIVWPRANYSPLGLAAMLEAGVDPTDEEQAIEWSYKVLQRYYERATAAAQKGNPQRPMFHNSGHIPKGAYSILNWNTHLELESLPTGGWGYDHFPISAKYAATTGKEFLGMTGKFHTTWGEFGGFKRPNALLYECDAMLAFGSKCSIGDQLHPSGAMNPDTYDLIGTAYGDVEAKEAWCRDVTPVADIALISPEALHTDRPGTFGTQDLAEEGAARMLLELGAQFDVIDLERNFSAYKVLLLPDAFVLDGALLQKVQTFLQGGGKLLLSGHSGLNADNDAFALDIGLRVVGKSEFDPDYLVPTDASPTPRVRGPFVIHGGAWDIEAGDDWRVLATRRTPYFNRRWNHFCSHQHTPDAIDSPYPAVLTNGEVVYFAHRIFTSYRQLGQPLYRDLLADALQVLLPQPGLQTGLPSAGRASLMHQRHENRYVLHLLFAMPQKRGAAASQWATGNQAVEVIEDLFPLHNIHCIVRVPEAISSVRLVPSGEEVPFETRDGAIEFFVPELLCHQMVEIGYKN